MTETDIMRQIMLALSAAGHKVFRANVGTFYTKDGRVVATGLPKGFSDLFGFRRGDGRAFFIEVKTPDGRVKQEQRTFLKAMEDAGALAGIARSAADAMEIVK